MSGDKDFQETEVLTRASLQFSEMDRNLFFELPSKILSLLGESCVGVSNNENFQDKVSLKIALQLASQLMQDFRACSLLSQLAYAGPAASVACSMYEGFYIFTSLRLSDSRIALWKEIIKNPTVNHYKKSPLGYGDARDLFYADIADPTEAEKMKESSREVYTYLSAMRHYNPRARQNLGLIASVDENEAVGAIGLTPSPYATSLGFGVIRSRYIMLVAVRYAVYIVRHLDEYYAGHGGDIVSDIFLASMDIFNQLESIKEWYNSSSEAHILNVELVESKRRGKT